MSIYGKTFKGSFETQLNIEVDRLEREKMFKKSKSTQYKNRMFATVECTQCKRKMSGKTGKEQIANKRENAPICVPCIMGIPRRDLSKVKK